MSGSCTGRSRSTWPGHGAWCRGRAGAPCPAFTGWVSPARPPNRTCDSHRIRLSTWSCRWCWWSCRLARPWCGDLGAPVAVALDGDRSWPEHLDPAVADLPAWQEAADESSPVQPEVAFAEPVEDPPPGEV